MESPIQIQCPIMHGGDSCLEKVQSLKQIAQELGRLHVPYPGARHACCIACAACSPTWMALGVVAAPSLPFSQHTSRCEPLTSLPSPGPLCPPSTYMTPDLGRDGSGFCKVFSPDPSLSCSRVTRAVCRRSPDITS